ARSDPVDACRVGRTVGIQPEAGFPHVGFGIDEAQGPEANVMALAWAVVDRFLKTDVLPAAKEIKGAEWCRRIGRVEYKGPDQAPGTCQAEPIGLRPAGKPEGGVELLQRARQHEIDRIAGQAVPGNCEARYAFARQDFEAHANDARQDN